MADGKSHCQNGQAESQCYTVETYAKTRKSRRQDRAAAPPQEPTRMCLKLPLPDVWKDACSPPEKQQQVQQQVVFVDSQKKNNLLIPRPSIFSEPCTNKKRSSRLTMFFNADHLASFLSGMDSRTSETPGFPTYCY
jgi:hypothetical protein